MNVREHQKGQSRMDKQKTHAKLNTRHKTKTNEKKKPQHRKDEIN